MEEELLAAIGQVVVDAAVLEYLIAVLVAVMKGQDEEWARSELAIHAGAARKALRRLVKERPERPDLGRLYQDAVAVIDDRHNLAHSIAMADMDTAGEPGMTIWNPRSDTEARITTPQVLEHARDIRIVARRALALIAKEHLGGH